MYATEAIKKIHDIQSGKGIDRTKFPELMKGELARNLWDDGAFSLGFEYGYLMALMDVYELSYEDIF